MLNAEFGMLNGRRWNTGRSGGERPAFAGAKSLLRRRKAIVFGGGGCLSRFERQALFQGCPQQVAGFFFAAQQVEVADILAAGIYVPADFDTK